MIIKPTTPKIYVPQDKSCVLNLDARDVRGGKIYDRSGKGNHGAITGAVLKPKNYGVPALKFDGVDDYVRIADNASLSPTSAMSSFIWVKGGEQLWNSFFAHNDSGIPQRSFIMWQRNQEPYNKMSVGISDDGTTDEGHRKRYESSIVAFDNTWHLIGFTFTAGTFKLYVDGVEDTNVTKTNDDAITTIHNSTADVIIGGSLASGVAAGAFNGDISGAKIWNRALSSQEVSKLFNKTKHLYGK